MKSVVITILALLISSHAFAQSEEDNLTFLKVQNNINDGEYKKALNLLESVSDPGKQSDFYLSYSATAYEQLYDFNNAVIYYRALYRKNNSFDVMKKVADVEEFAKNKQGCIKIVNGLREQGMEIETDLFMAENGKKFMVLIGKYQGKYMVTFFSLPSFDLKMVLAGVAELYNPENGDTPYYSVDGTFKGRFVGEYSACNKDVPDAKAFGMLYPGNQRIEALVFSYYCDKHDDGTFTVRVNSKDPDLFKYRKLSTFNIE